MGIFAQGLLGDYSSDKSLESEEGGRAASFRDLGTRRCPSWLLASHSKVDANWRMVLSGVFCAEGRSGSGNGVIVGYLEGIIQVAHNILMNLSQPIFGCPSWSKSSVPPSYLRLGVGGLKCPIY